MIISTLTAILTAVLTAVLTLTTSPAAAAAAPVLLTSQESRYPHAIRLEHGKHRGSILVALHGSHVVNVLRAGKTGKKFRQVGTFTDEVSAHATCCGHLYELPQPVGEMSAGTVLWAGSVGSLQEGLKARIWRSDDGGETWRHLSECARAMPGGGLWEADLSVDSQGRLNCYFADETHPDHSRFIGRCRRTG